MNFGRKSRKQPEAPSDLVPKIKQSETYHPKIRSNLEIHTEDQELKSHNEVAFERYGLNAILDFPNPVVDHDIPDYLKNHMNKNISVPDGEDGNNVTGSILGIKNVYIDNYGYLPFYIVLFQADEKHKNEKHNEAIVRLIYTKKFGIRVLGIETEDEMMALIEKAKAAHLANQDSVEMQILQAKAAIDNQQRPRKLFGKKKDKESIAVNLGKDNFSGNDYASMMKQTGKTTTPNITEFGRPDTQASGKTKRRRRRRTIRRVNKGKKTKKTKRR